MKRVIILTDENNNRASFRRWIKRHGLQGKVRIQETHVTSLIYATVRGEAALTLFALMFVSYDAGTDMYGYPSMMPMYTFPGNAKW